MSGYSKLNYISDLWYGNDSTRITSFERDLSSAPPREVADHLLSLGSRLVQHVDEQVTTSNPGAIKRLATVLKSTSPSLLEAVPCDYKRFNSTHAIGEVILNLGDLAQSPTTALKVYEKMYDLSHPEDCEHIDRTAFKEAKAYHAIETREIDELYVSDNHLAVLEKIGLDTELFNSLYVDRQEELSKLIAQLERAKQFKTAFQCSQFLHTPSTSTLSYANQAFVSRNYEEASFLFNEAFKTTFPHDMQCLSTFFTAFVESLERSGQRDYLIIILDTLLENHHGAHLLLDSLIYLPNLQNLLFQNQGLRQKLFILILTKTQDYPSILHQTQDYLRDRIQTLDETVLKDFKRFYLAMGMTFYDAIFQIFLWKNISLLPEDIKWFYPLIAQYKKYDNDQATAALTTAINTFGEKPLLTMILDHLSTNPDSNASALLDSLVYLPNLESALFQDEVLRRKLFALILKTPTNYLNILSQTQRYLKDEVHSIDPAILADFKEFYEKIGLALSPSEEAYPFYEAAFQYIIQHNLPLLSCNEPRYLNDLLEFLAKNHPVKAITILKETLEALQIFAYQLPLNDRWLDISSYLYESLLRLTPKDPHILFCFAMQKKFHYLMLQKNDPTTARYTQENFKNILEIFLDAYKYAKGHTKDVYLAAIGDLISDAAMRGFALTSQDKKLLKSSKQITAVYALPDFGGEDFFEPIPDVTEHNLTPITDEETLFGKFAKDFKKKARVQDIPDDLVLPSQDDPRFAIWETYQRISSHINDAIYPDFSQWGKAEVKKIPDKTQIPSLSGNYGI